MRIAGPTLFSHYDDDPGLTAESVVDGWFLTSDAGRLDEDGRLQVIGRVDDVVVSGGVKVPVTAVARRLREHLLVDRRRGPRRPRRGVGPAGRRRRRRHRRRGRAARLGQPRAPPVVGAARVPVGREPAAAAQRQGRPPGHPGRALMAPDAWTTCTSSPSRCAPGSAASPSVRACCCAATPAGGSGRPSWSTTTPTSASVARVRPRGGRRRAGRSRCATVVPVNVTVPATDPERAHAIVTAGGCRTAKVKVAERGQTLADDVARVEAVRDALGPDGLVRVDANGAWDVDEAVRAIAAIDRAAGGLEYVEQPVDGRRGPRRRTPSGRRAGRGRRVDPPGRGPLPRPRPRGRRHRRAQGAAARRGAGLPADRRGHRPAGRGLQRRRVERRHRRRRRPRRRAPRAPPRLRARDGPAPDRRRGHRPDAARSTGCCGWAGRRWTTRRWRRLSGRRGPGRTTGVDRLEPR